MVCAIRQGSASRRESASNYIDLQLQLCKTLNIQVLKLQLRAHTEIITSVDAVHTLLPGDKQCGIHSVTVLAPEEMAQPQPKPENGTVQQGFNAWEIKRSLTTPHSSGCPPGIPSRHPGAPLTLTAPLQSLSGQKIQCQISPCLCYSHPNY